MSTTPMPAKCHDPTPMLCPLSRDAMRVTVDGGGEVIDSGYDDVVVEYWYNT